MLLRRLVSTLKMQRSAFMRSSVSRRERRLADDVARRGELVRREARRCRRARSRRCGIACAEARERRRREDQVERARLGRADDQRQGIVRHDASSRRDRTRHSHLCFTHRLNDLQLRKIDLSVYDDGVDSSAVHGRRMMAQRQAGSGVRRSTTWQAAPACPPPRSPRSCRASPPCSPRTRSVSSMPSSARLPRRPARLGPAPRQAPHHRRDRPGIRKRVLRLDGHPARAAGRAARLCAGRRVEPRIGSARARHPRAHARLAGLRRGAGAGAQRARAGRRADEGNMA